MITLALLESKLKIAYPDCTYLSVNDISGGCGASYEVIIVSPSFQGLSTLKRHREVNARLKEEIAELHAFTQKTYTPEQYAALPSKSN